MERFQRLRERVLLLQRPCQVPEPPEPPLLLRPDFCAVARHVKVLSSAVDIRHVFGCVGQALCWCQFVSSWGRWSVSLAQAVWQKCGKGDRSEVG